MSFMVFKPTTQGISDMSNLMQPRTAQMSSAQTRPSNQVPLPFAESIHVFDPSWHPPTPQSQARPLAPSLQFPRSPYQHPHLSPRYSNNNNNNAQQQQQQQQQQTRDTIPAPATLTAPGVTIGAIALTCYDELALIRYCVDFQGYYRSGYRTKFWVAARKALRSVVGKDVEDVEQRMRVLLAKRRVEKGQLEDHGVVRKALVMPEYRELLDKWDDRVRYVESGHEKVASRETGMDAGDSDGVTSPVKGAAEVPNMTTPSSNPGWLIESPTRAHETSEEPSPAQNTNNTPGDKPHRTRLKPAEEVVLLRLCVQHKDLYKTLFKAAFWKVIQKKLREETGKHFTNPDGRIKVLLKRREQERKELQDRGRLSVDLVDRRYKPWLDKWQECVNEVGGHRKRRTRDGAELQSADDVLGDADADAVQQQPSPQTSDAFHNGVTGTDGYPQRHDHGFGLGLGLGHEHDVDLESLRAEHDKIMHDLSSDMNVDNTLLLRLEGNRAKQMDLFRRRLHSVTDTLSSMSREREELRRQIEGLKKGVET